MKGYLSSVCFLKAYFNAYWCCCVLTINILRQSFISRKNKTKTTRNQKEFCQREIVKTVAMWNRTTLLSLRTFVHGRYNQKYSSEEGVSSSRMTDLNELPLLSISEIIEESIFVPSIKISIINSNGKLSWYINELLRQHFSWLLFTKSLILKTKHLILKRTGGILNYIWVYL